MFSQILLIKAMNLGDTSVSTLFYSSGFLIPIFASVFLYDESVSVWQWIGVFLMLLSFVVTVKKKEKAATLKWFGFVLIALLCNGILGMMPKVVGMSAFRDQQSSFIMVCCFAGMVTAFLFMPKKISPCRPNSFEGRRQAQGLLWALSMQSTCIFPVFYRA